ncbi:MAG: hypothetical protein AAGB29_11075 [Planctomycetota bacterium]
MPEPGKANLWKSWVRWVSIGFTLCILLSIVVPTGYGLLIGYGHATGALAEVLLPLATVALLGFGVLGGIVWSVFVAPIVIAGDLRHQRWKDRPKKLHDRLAFGPMTPAAIAGAIGLLLPAIVVVLSIVMDEPLLRADFPFVRFVAVAVFVTAVLAAIGWPFRVLTQRRFRRTIAAARICFGCGYNLRGTTSNACPECGEPVPDTPAASPQHD